MGRLQRMGQHREMAPLQEMAHLQEMAPHQAMAPHQETVQRMLPRLLPLLFLLRHQCHQSTRPLLLMLLKVELQRLLH
ncbi:hypothetical protein TELCIR_24526 [Teladorsagia circumcincta]|uniref:Uncharacterized protein n=1 Tax=Teladorsagia circumcincta TaxID=45464 RepID=A0A2G9T8A4_TELCI|nr:hypothetical protein TELCIR_24526 [Teladorsagia circumcincta]